MKIEYKEQSVDMNERLISYNAIDDFGIKFKLSNKEKTNLSYVKTKFDELVSILNGETKTLIEFIKKDYFLFGILLKRKSSLLNEDNWNNYVLSSFNRYAKISEKLKSINFNKIDRKILEDNKKILIDYHAYYLSDTDKIKL